MTRDYARYLLWRGGRLPEHRIGFADLTWWLEDAASPVGQMQVEHTHTVVGRRR